MISSSSPEKLKEEWLVRLSNLIRSVERWAEELGWATKKIEFTLSDSQLGKYKAPALLLQDENIRILLEPIARFVPGADGVVDLYLMPAYDDIASLYLQNEDWHLHYLVPGVPSPPAIRGADGKTLSLDVLRDVLEAMKENAIQEI